MSEKKYKYVPVSEAKKLNLSRFPNAGPRPNITGMRNKYWGQGAYIIKSGNYAYHVDKETFEKA